MPSVDAAAAALPGLWFDGTSSRARPVLVRLVASGAGPRLQVASQDEPEALLFERESEAIGWPERFRAHALPPSVIVDLREQGSLEMPDPQAWMRAMAAAGAQPTLAERMQTQWQVLLGVAVLAVVVLGAFYRWGTPWLATQVARHVPLGWELGLAERALADLDRHWLEPSQVPRERQAALRGQFETLVRLERQQPARWPDYAPQLRLEFRKGFGANAFALPGGTIVMTDGLLEMAERHRLGDDALIGVLAHEMGHVTHRHATRMVVQHGILNVGLGLALGDTSWVFANGSALLTTLHYSRKHEREADCHAIALMRAAGRPAAPMGELLLKITSAAAQEKTAEAPRESRGWGELLSTHPDTPQRARDLAEGQSAACE